MTAMQQLTLALHQPVIPQNAGTTPRACARWGFQAAIIGPTGFAAAGTSTRRDGLCCDQLTISRHISFESFQHWRKSTQQGSQARRLILLSTKAEGSYLDLAYQPDDILMVGRESAGVPEEVAAASDAVCEILQLLPRAHSMLRSPPQSLWARPSASLDPKALTAGCKQKFGDTDDLKFRFAPKP